MIAIDKELPALELIRNYTGSFPHLKLIQTFEDVITGGEFLRNNEIDLLFIELNMPADTTIKLVRSIQQKLTVIFTVSSTQLTPEILELDALDYLVKPIKFERFTRAIAKATQQHQNVNPEKTNGDAIYIRSEYHLMKINLGEIEYIESVENYIKIHLTNSKPVMSLMTLKVILEQLSQEKFLRIHRSYIIAVDKIKYIGNKKIKMNSTELPVGFRYLINLKLLINR